MQSKRILVVEDDDAIRESFAQLLELCGYSVTQARNGREALRLLRMPEKPALILLDLMMPVLNGWEFLAERTRDEDVSAIPVVVVSATEEAPLLPAGDGFLRKPVDFHELIHTVQHHCIG